MSKVALEQLVLAASDSEICENFLSVQAEEFDLECKALIAESVVYRSDSNQEELH